MKSKKRNKLKFSLIEKRDFAFIPVGMVICILAFLCILKEALNNNSADLYSIMCSIYISLFGAVMVIFSTRLSIEISQRQLNQQLRLQSLPFINLQEDALNSVDKRNNVKSVKIIFDPIGSSIPAYLRLTNIGKGPAISMKFCNEQLGHCSVGEYNLLEVYVFTKHSPSVSFNIVFWNIEGQKYKQTVTLKLLNNLYCFESITPPELCK